MIIAEKEIKLLVNKEGGRSLLQELLFASSIDSFELCNAISHEIEDAYFDYDDLTLRNSNAYLRLRGRKDLHTITFRREIAVNDSVQIDETTHPMSDGGLKIIFDIMDESNYLRSPPIFSKPLVAEVFQSVGLREKVRIITKRVEKEIHVEDLKIGKIKFDEFFYYFRPDDTHYIIEIDTYRKAYHSAIDGLVNSLYMKYGYRVESVFKSKYVRGIEMLYNNLPFEANGGKHV